MSLADSKKKKNANQEIRGFWNDFISCQTGMLQDDWVTDQVRKQEKPTNSWQTFHKWLSYFK